MQIPSGTMNQLAPGMVAVLGLPLDENSSFHHGPAQAPAAIRQVLNSGVGNWCCEAGPDLSQDQRWLDLGDLDLSGLHGQAAFDAITRAVSGVLDVASRPMLLGGDHSVTFPVVRAVAAKFACLNILHLDAHPDLYDDFEGNPLSHASPFARIMEAGLAVRLVQAGVRTRTPHQRRQAERFSVESLEMRDLHAWGRLSFDGPLYLSLDLDVLDPAFAPGISHHEPGGLSTRQLLDLLQGLEANLVGADIVELNPARDPSGISAALGAKLYKEILARLLGI